MKMDEKFMFFCEIAFVVFLVFIFIITSQTDIYLYK